ncbi:PREDICTED: putative 1-phosphatidylinositol-3-phosphate 5-kinase FAB1C isoform X2 [Nelumbo nucifera]|uniref:1-phosphatidylinositol-3-phosphate 5-kinase n=1 Tax=Nelumbo nucifera TaxID=4432 RepID=A0A1U8BE53_NELNU|nr:PREDICTED: putative 1-phosphatidylinositol-3-phosphate 5-kinase FAB1C isoform X2 [Nelumbo nucifera]
MGIPDNSLIDLIEKVRSWISWGGNDLSGFSKEFWMTDNSCSMCCECEKRFTEFSFHYHCQGCGRVLCGKCIEGPCAISDRWRSSTEDAEHVKHCKFCFQANHGHEAGRDRDERIISSRSPQLSPERMLPHFSNGKFCDDNNCRPLHSDHLVHFFESQEHAASPYATASSSMPSSMGHLSPVSFHCSPSRSDEEDAEDSGKHFLSPSSEYYQDISDVDSSSVSSRHDFYSFKSVGSSPLESSYKITSTPNRAHYSVQKEQGGTPRSQNDTPPYQEKNAILRRPETENEDLENPDDCSDALSIFREQCEKVQQPLDFENNGLIWFPPPAEEGEDELESNFFEYDDEDDDVGGSGMFFSSGSFSNDAFPVREKPKEEYKEPLRAVIHGHFRSLVSQLLQGEGICVENENGVEDWLDIVASIAWQAANFVKPDTNRGGSMDPGDYVKVKCIVSGSPSESTLIKGVVCTKNIKHKRMMSQYKNPRLLLLGGSLEFQRVPNQLSSFNTLLEQEMDHLKMIVSKIEAHRPNVLLVEKSVSSYAQEYLLAKEISLVLNVKRPLLERIARCTGASIVPSIDNLSSSRLGHCEIFRLERVSEENKVPGHPNKKLAKTLMFFEGCPRRLGCTVLLKGTCHEELKKVKHVIQYAVFAAYHLSLETSFLADEGATLPKIPLSPSISKPERMVNADKSISLVSGSAVSSTDELYYRVAGNMLEASSPRVSSDALDQDEGSVGLCLKLREQDQFREHFNPVNISTSSSCFRYSIRKAQCHVSGDHVVMDIRDRSQHDSLETSIQDEEIASRSYQHPGKVHELPKTDGTDEVSGEIFSAAEKHQSILVSFSSRCVLKGTVCERSQLLRIKFYGNFDKPLGRFLRDDLFDQTSLCRSCKEPAEAHVRCYTHQQGSLTINVRRLPSLKLPGECDGKIWMWHRCLKCAYKDGVPPAARRVVMSDAAWGLSFGKFLELSFSNHATANRVASCGHSLQRDCLRYYGFGSMVAFFRYSPIDILSICLPPSMLEFNGHIQQEWVRQEAVELLTKMELLYTEVFDALHNIEQKGMSFGHEPTNKSEFHNHIMELKDLLKKERHEYDGLVQPARLDDIHPGQIAVDILELNRLRRYLFIDCYIWDRRLCSLNSIFGVKSSISKVDSRMQEAATCSKMAELKSESFRKDGRFRCAHDENSSKSLVKNLKHALYSEHREEHSLEYLEPTKNQPAEVDSSNSTDDYGHEDLELATFHLHKLNRMHADGEVTGQKVSMESIPSPTSNLSETIDLAWTGTGKQPMKVQLLQPFQTDRHQTGSAGFINQMNNQSYRRLMSPVRVYSFDSALRVQERICKGQSPTSLRLTSVKSFHASGDYRSMIRDPIPNMLKTYPQVLPRQAKNLNFMFSSPPSFITSASSMAGEGVRLLLPQTGHNNIVVAVYDSEPTSVISYALSCKDYDDWIAGKSSENGGGWSVNDNSKEDELSSLSGYLYVSGSEFSARQSFGSLDSDDHHYISYRFDDRSSSIGSLPSDSKKSPHLRISFGDESSSPGSKVKFSVTCYFAKQFHVLRKKCCPSEVDFIRSLSRCKRWHAQGGKSNAYFAKSLDERFIVKQVTKTELDSFEEFAPKYFKYLIDSLTSGSPTCLAKVLGIYQVSIKHLKGGKEMKMDLMVMENLFYKRNISRVYDLKGSARSRYNPDTTGKNNVLLDMNLLEALRTKPIFLGSKAKRSLERAVWNDTSFLASVDVMDYSLLVGVDNDQKELVIGIIDFMRQYTWDKHLETWVKASGILGGPKNASPTIISPKQYKKRFRKAMTTYFHTVPDQWSS